ncbi:hypothetical protein P0G10_18565 [Eubacteriales bacterium DFI.9.88]|nr:hypothetical protein [Eubacteriales bacterium DFI.9.88]
MNTYINALYNGTLYPAEQVCPRTEEYLTVLHNLSDLHGSFEKMLTPPLKNAFEAFLNEQHNRISMEIQAAFTYGYKLGANLMIETLGRPSEEE